MLGLVEKVSRLTLAQRIVLVVAFAATLRLVGLFIESVGSTDGGWFGYAPNSRALYLERGGIGSFASILVWLGLVVVWALVSVWLLGAGGSPEDDPDEE